MNDADRLVLTAVLARLRPGCSIEVGTAGGGSLSAIARYSKITYSVDVAPDPPAWLRNSGKVRIITGRSGDILPWLLQKLDEAGTPPEFVLIDGDHTAGGVRADIGCLLAYTPRRPMVILMHDSFNPECRRGILEAGWERSPYVRQVEVDFSRGRMHEEGSLKGEMWGGLAMAYFKPTPRPGPLEVRCSGEMTFRIINGQRQQW